METVVILLALFGVKHFLADFLWQFPYMVRDKGHYGPDAHQEFAEQILVPKLKELSIL